MEFINTIGGFLSEFGFALILPISILIFGLILGMKIKNAFISALTVGVAFIGMGIMISFLIGILDPALTALIDKTGVNLKSIDVGWGIIATITFGTCIGALVMPLAYGLNFIMLKLGWTKTLNTDIWNYWHYALTASLTYIASGGSIVLSLVAVSLHCIYTLVIADLTAKKVQEFFSVPGISVPHGWLVTSVPVIWALDKIVEKTPGLKDIDWKAEGVIKKLGIFGQPLILGAILGLILGLIAYGVKVAALILALQITAIFLLIPNIIPFFKDGFALLSEACQQSLTKHSKVKEHYLVMDYGVLIGHPNNIAAGLLLIPITIGLSLLLPGITTIPLADLSLTAFFIAMIPPLTKGNFFRSVLYGTVIMIMVIYIANSLAPGFSQIAGSVGFEIPSETGMITSLAGGNWIAWVFYRIAELII